MSPLIKTPLEKAGSKKRAISRPRIPGDEILSRSFTQRARLISYSFEITRAICALHFTSACSARFEDPREENREEDESCDRGWRELRAVESEGKTEVGVTNRC